MLDSTFITTAAEKLSDHLYNTNIIQGSPSPIPQRIHNEDLGQNRYILDTYCHRNNVVELVLKRRNELYEYTEIIGRTFIIANYQYSPESLETLLMLMQVPQ